jgi:hypothetical protein
MNKIPINENFIIFLNPSYFKKTIYRTFYDKLKQNLQNKGINIFNIKTTIDEINNSSLQLLFDDSPFPSTNTLYIHLYNGLYYNDNIYIKKKVHYEREMLFLLSAALGVKYIEYKTDVVETIITRAHCSLGIKKIKNSINYSKDTKINNGTSGKEEYSNNGSPILIDSMSINDVENRIKNELGQMSSNIFNIDFYKKNPKLESFVYKRFQYKMNRLEYNIESEDISDISFSVKSTFMEYGLNIAFDKNVIYSEKISFVLDFYTHDELKKENRNVKTTKGYDNDKLMILRLDYDECDTEIDKKKIAKQIIDYIITISKECNYYDKNNQKLNYSKKLYDYLKDTNNHNKLEEMCVNFHTTDQIKNWIYTTFYDKDNEQFSPFMHSIRTNKGYNKKFSFDNTGLMV